MSMNAKHSCQAKSPLYFYVDGLFSVGVIVIVIIVFYQSLNVKYFCIDSHHLKNIISLRPLCLNLSYILVKFTL